MTRTARWWSVDLACVGSYLGAIVAANFAVARWGQSALPFTALVLIPFDLCTRDVLHERWRGGGPAALWVRMGLLILTGSALSAALSWTVASVALASFCAFAAAGCIDAVAYAAVPRKHGRWVRMNVSNLFGAIADSIVFPLVAFGGGTVALMVAQASSKFVGGMVLSALFVWAAGRPWKESE